jgi:hypothetical protein
MFILSVMPCKKMQVSRLTKVTYSGLHLIFRFTPINLHKLNKLKKNERKKVRKKEREKERKKEKKKEKGKEKKDVLHI